VIVLSAWVSVFFGDFASKEFLWVVRLGVYMIEML